MMENSQTGSELDLNIDVFGEVTQSDIERLWKQENLEFGNSTSDFILEDNVFPPMEILPDSTQQRVSVMRTFTISTGVQPSLDNYSGPYLFDVEVNKGAGGKLKWEFCKEINKLFALMDCKIPVYFKWNLSEVGLHVRVLPVYLAPDSFSDPVRRCPTHLSKLEKSNRGFLYVDHVVRCHHAGAIYEKDIESGRLSVVVPLETPQPGSDWTTVVYSFMCKNSCYLGMNRRSTALIFTLERQNGEVVGRKVINMRICSCPRRDLIKERDSRNKRQREDEEEGSQAVEEFSAKKSRLSKDLVNVRVPKSYLKAFHEIIKRNEYDRSLTTDEKIALEDFKRFM